MPTVSAFIERLKLHKLYVFIEREWISLKENMDEVIIYEQKSTEDRFFSLAGIDKDKWQKLKFTGNDPDMTAEKINHILKTHINDIPENEFNSKYWARAKRYTDVIEKAVGAFNITIEWDQKNYKWFLTNRENGLSSNWQLDDLLKRTLIDHLSGTNWYIYKYSRYGIQRMILTIADEPNEEGFYSAYIVRGLEIGVKKREEDIIFEGKVFSEKNKKTVFIFQDNGLRYAHLILFTGELERNVKLQICMGHFTYFSTTPGVGKYLTKSVVAILTSDDSLKVKTISTLDHCSIPGEELILRYLSDRQKNRLTSIGDHIYSIRGLSLWFDKNIANKGETINSVIESYKGNYYIFYVKKHPKNAENESNFLEFFQDKLMLSYLENETALEANYQHFESPEEGSLDFGKTRLHNYTGRVNMKQHFIYGLLLSTEQDPLYVSMHVPLNSYKENMECFIGSVTGERDNGMVIVSYTCVIVPFKQLPTDQQSTVTKREKIRDFLEREVERGWSVIDPSMNKAFSFRINNLTSINN